MWKARKKSATKCIQMFWWASSSGKAPGWLAAEGHVGRVKNLKCIVKLRRTFKTGEGKAIHNCHNWQVMASSFSVQCRPWIKWTSCWATPSYDAVVPKSMECKKCARGARAIPSPSTGALTGCVPIPTKPPCCCMQQNGFYRAHLDECH